MSRWQLLSRPGCGLCEEMLEALAVLPAAQGLAIEVLDVDRQEAYRVRYGHKIPVLLLDGEPVCRGRLDPAEVLRALAALDGNADPDRKV